MPIPCSKSLWDGDFEGWRCVKLTGSNPIEATLDIVMTIDYSLTTVMFNAKPDMTWKKVHSSVLVQLLIQLLSSIQAQQGIKIVLIIRFSKATWYTKHALGHSVALLSAAAILSAAAHKL